jgi:hypothetical protein
LSGWADASAVYVAGIYGIPFEGDEAFVMRCAP